MIASANPKASYLAHQEELNKAIQSVMDNGWYIMGPQLKSFEENFARYIGVSHCIGVGNGTDALHFALRACGVESGDGVITVSHTAVATVSAIEWLGAVPFLVDIKEDTFTIDPQKVEDTLKNNSKRIKAVIAVNLYGQPADLPVLSEITDRYHISLIEDCAQSHGASVNSKITGSYGKCSGFSFYPTKNLGAFGDGGAIVTDDDQIADRLRLLRQYGWRNRYISDEIGYNSRLDELQAAILNCKLKWLDKDNARRIKIAGMYRQGLAGLPLVLPSEIKGYRHTFHQFVIRHSDRDSLRIYLENNQIQTSILYPKPIHLQNGYKNRIVIGNGGLGVSEQICNEILCLPIYPELSNSEVDFVIGKIQQFFQRSGNE